MLKTRILFFGGEGVGKTTLLYLMKSNEIVNTNTTISFNVEDIVYKYKKINKYMGYWRRRQKKIFMETLFRKCKMYCFYNKYI